MKPLDEEITLDERRKKRPLSVVCSGTTEEICQRRVTGTWNPETGAADLPEGWIARPPFAFCPDHRKGVRAVEARLPKSYEEGEQMGREAARAIMFLRAHYDPTVQAAAEVLLTTIAAMSDDMIMMRRHLNGVGLGLERVAESLEGRLLEVALSKKEPA